MRRRVVFTRLRDWWTCPRACCTTPRQRATPLPPSPPPVRYFIGSTDRPLTRASRWRCGPVTLPVAPTEPTRAPCLMPMPTLAAIADMCAYSDDSPPPWEMVTCLPYGPPLVADLTVPLSTATTVVPVGAGKSRPVCRPLDHMRPFTPNRVPYGAFTGLIHAPVPSGMSLPRMESIARSMRPIGAPATIPGHVPLLVPSPRVMPDLMGLNAFSARFANPPRTTSEPLLRALPTPLAMLDPMLDRLEPIAPKMPPSANPYCCRAIAGFCPRIAAWFMAWRRARSYGSRMTSETYTPSPRRIGTSWSAPSRQVDQPGRMPPRARPFGIAIFFISGTPGMRAAVWFQTPTMPPVSTVSTPHRTGAATCFFKPPQMSPWLSRIRRNPPRRPSPNRSKPCRVIRQVTEAMLSTRFQKEAQIRSEERRVGK